MLDKNCRITDLQKKINNLSSTVFNSDLFNKYSNELLATLLDMELIDKKLWRQERNDLLSSLILEVENPKFSVFYQILQDCQDHKNMAKIELFVNHDAILDDSKAERPQIKTFLEITKELFSKGDDCITYEVVDKSDGQVHVPNGDCFRKKCCEQKIKLDSFKKGLFRNLNKISARQAPDPNDQVDFSKLPFWSDVYCKDFSLKLDAIYGKSKVTKLLVILLYQQFQWCHHGTGTILTNDHKLDLNFGELLYCHLINNMAEPIYESIRDDNVPRKRPIPKPRTKINKVTNDKLTDQDDDYAEIYDKHDEIDDKQGKPIEIGSIHDDPDDKCSKEELTNIDTITSSDNHDKDVESSVNSLLSEVKSCPGSSSIDQVPSPQDEALPEVQRQNLIHRVPGPNSVKHNANDHEHLSKSQAPLPNDRVSILRNQALVLFDQENLAKDQVYDIKGKQPFFNDQAPILKLPTKVPLQLHHKNQDQSQVPLPKEKELVVAEHIKDVKVGPKEVPLKLLSKSDIEAMMTRKKPLTRKKLKSKKPSRPVLNLPPLLRLEKVKPSTVYFPKITYFQGSLFRDDVQVPVIKDDYKAGLFDKYLDQAGMDNNFASIQFSIRKELDKKLVTPDKNLLKIDASTATVDKKEASTVVDASVQAAKPSHDKCLDVQHWDQSKPKKLCEIAIQTEDEKVELVHLNIGDKCLEIDNKSTQCELLVEVTEKSEQDTAEKSEQVRVKTPEVLPNIGKDKCLDEVIELKIPTIEITPPIDSEPSSESDNEGTSPGSSFLNKKQIVIKLDVAEETDDDDQDSDDDDHDEDITTTRDDIENILKEVEEVAISRLELPFTSTYVVSQSRMRHMPAYGSSVQTLEDIIEVQSQESSN